MTLLLRSLLLIILFLVLANFSVWGTLALWFKAPGSVVFSGALAGAFALLGLGTLVALFTAARLRWLFVYAISFGILLTWWTSLAPPSDGNWSPDVAEQSTGVIDGDILTIENVRAFNWRAKDDFDEAWVTRSYDMSQITSVDLFMSYWAGPAMAHLIVSYGFADGQNLAWSIEVRRLIGGSFSPVADYFKANTIAVVASEERDVVGVRTNIRKERVQLFQLRGDRVKQGAARDMLTAYVDLANSVAEEPQWFHSVFSNCSRTVVNLARSVGITLPVDYRVIVNGYFPEYLYERGVMNTDFTLDELYALGDISARAQEAGLTDGYAAAIRAGMPMP